MNSDLRSCSLIALLAICGFAPVAFAEPAGPERVNNSTASAAVLDEDSQGSVSLSAAGVATTGNVGLSAEGAESEVDEPRKRTDRHLTIRQKRIFVLGLSEQENR